MAGFDLNAPLPKGSGAGNSRVEEMFPEVFGSSGEAPRRSTAPAATPTPAPAATPTPAPAAVPTPAPREEYQPVTAYVDDPNMSKMDYIKGALSNAPGSAGEIGQGLYEALRPSNWDKTGAALATLGAGAISKVNTALGGHDTSPEGEAAVDAFLEDLAKRWEDPAKSFYEHPFSIGLDVASVAPVAGAVGRVGGLGKVATAAERVASLGDPVNLAVQGAKLTGRGVTGTARAISPYPSAVASGVPIRAMRAAGEIGRSGDAGARNAFRSVMTGTTEPRDVARLVMDSVEERAREVSNYYTTQRRALTTQPLSMVSIRNALNDAMTTANRYGTRVGTDVVDALNRMDAKVKMYELHPNPGARTAVELDLLKRDLRDIVNDLKPSDRGAVSKVPNAVRDTISAVDSNYAKMMDYWQDWMRQMRDFQTTLGTGDRVSETARLTKLTSAMKSGDKMNLLKQLRGTPSGKYLSEMIAGLAFRDLMPPMYQGFGLGFLGSALAGGPHGVAMAAAGSPRLAGLGQYGLGRLEGAINAVPKPPAFVNDLAYNLGQQQAFGGRVERKSGGRVDVDHEKLADGLVRAAESAKKGISRGTEALLDTPDDHIASALQKANEAL